MKRLLLIITVLTFGTLLIAQTPQGFRYQAVARNAQNNPLNGASITVRIGILQDEVLVWQEDHQVTTNSMGMFSLVIGDPGAIASGGTLDAFSDISWSAGEHMLNVQVDAGEGFVDMGTEPFLSVPYALHAESAEGDGDTDPSNELQDLQFSEGQLSLSDDPNPNTIDMGNILTQGVGWQREIDTVSFAGNVGIGTNRPYGSKLSVQGDQLAGEEPLFEVKRQDGTPVFVVYNDGVRVFVPEGTKSAKGGFAVGGYQTGKNYDEGQEFLRVTPDSVRVYVPDDSQAKGLKGGFAVGGYNIDTKRPTDYLMGINRSTTQFYTSDPRSGFTLGDLGSGDKPKYMQLTPYNYLIGLNAGASLDPGVESPSAGKYNAFIGYQAGRSDVSGRYNLFIGHNAGRDNTGSGTALDGNFNAFIGHNAGTNNSTGYQNVFLGSNAGNSNTTGNENVFVGFQTGLNNTGGSSNVFVGDAAGFSNSGGTSNIFIGQNAGYNNTSGNNNIMLGRVAGYLGTAHENNIFIGDSTGYFTNDQFATKNVFIGYAAGKNTQSYNNIFIGNRAGYYNSGGQNNIAIGDQAGLNTNSSQNIFIGTQAGRDNTDGFFNIIMGRYAGRNNTTGSHQVIIGGGAGGSLTTGSENVFVGGTAGSVNETGSGNIYLGYGAGWSNTGSNNIFIGRRVGYGNFQDVSDKLVVDNSSSTQPLLYGDFSSDDLLINGTVRVANHDDFYGAHGLIIDTDGENTDEPFRIRTNGSPGSWTDADTRMLVYGDGRVLMPEVYEDYVTGRDLYINSSGQLGYYSSSRKYKEDIRDMSDVSWMMNLRPVMFHYKDDDARRQHYGLIAEEVETVRKDFVSYNRKGEVETVHYDQLITPIIKLVQQQQQQIDEQQEEIEQLRQEKASYAELEEKLQQLEEKVRILDNLANK